MQTFVKRIGGAAAIGVAMLVGGGLSAPLAQAAYIVTLEQVGTNVVATGIGSLNPTAFTISDTNITAQAAAYLSNGLHYCRTTRTYQRYHLSSTHQLYRPIQFWPRIWHRPHHRFRTDSRALKPGHPTHPHRPCRLRLRLPPRNQYRYLGKCVVQ